MNEPTSSTPSQPRPAFSNSGEPTRFSNREEFERVGEYKKFNIAALVALLFGLASVFVLASTMAWIVPFIAVIVGAIALWLAAREENMGGRYFAWAGIFLALFFSSMSAAHFFGDRGVLYQEAEVIGSKWLRLVTEGEAEIAHQAMMPVARRQARGFSVDDFYAKSKDSTVAKDKVFTNSPAIDIMALGPEAKIQLVGNHRQNVDLKYGKLIFQTYRISAEGKKPVEATLVIARSYKADIDSVTWIVADIKHPDDI